MKIGIITGASSGLGAEFVEAVEKTYKGLDELWILARRVDRLEELAGKYKRIKIRPVQLDVTDDAAVAEFIALLEQEKASIKLLINNAGRGAYGRFDEVALEDHLKVFDTNARATLVFVKSCLPYVAKGGDIILTCSVSSFTPSTNMVIYSATKSFVQAFGIGLREELKKKKIHVTTLCPGWMETEFFEVAGMVGIDMEGSIPHQNMKKLTRKALKDVKKNKLFTVMGPFNKFFYYTSKFLPRQLMIKMAAE